VRVAPLDRALQVYVPFILRQCLLLLENTVARAGHPGVNRMYASIRRNYYWESMAADVYDWAASCASCARNRIAPRRVTAILNLFAAPDPFASLSMDLLGPLKETKTGYVFLLIIVDRFSELVRAVPLAGVTATDGSSAFCPDWIYVPGPPDTVLTDNGPQFASLIFQGVCILTGIRNMYKSTYHSRINSQVARSKKTLLNMFMHYIEVQQDYWDELVSVLALAYNSRPHLTTYVAPMDLVTPLRLSNFSLERMPDGMQPDPSQAAAEAKDAFLESLKALLPQIRNSIAKTQAGYKWDYGKKVRPRPVTVTSGDWVDLRSHSRKRKLDPKVHGPCEVLETHGKTYLIDQDGLPYRVSGDHVVPAGPADPASRPKQPQVEIPDALQPGGSEFVFERFVSHTWDEEGVLWSLARCFGYGSDDDTWQHSGRLPVAAVYRYCRRKGLLLQDPDKV